MDNKKSIKNMAYAAIVLAVFFFCASWLSTDSGFKMFSEFVKDVPFANFIFKTGCGILDIQVSEPDLGVSTVAVSLPKMIVSTAFKALIFSIFMIPLGYLTGILDAACIAAPIIGMNFTSMGIKILEKVMASRTAWIDNAEAILDSWWYKRIENIVTLLAATLSELIVTKFLFKRYQNFLNSIGEQATLFISVILCFALFWLYSYIFSGKNNMGRLSGVIKTLFFQIIPELFSLFCINVFYFLVYAIAAAGASKELVLCLILLLVLISLWEDIKKKLLAWCAGHLKSDRQTTANYMTLDDFIGGLATALPVLISFYLMLFTMFISIGTTPSERKLLLGFPFLETLLIGNAIGDLFNSAGGSMVSLPLIKLFVVTLITVWLLRSKVASNIFVWVLFWCGAVLSIDLFACCILEWLISSPYGTGVLYILGILLICLFLYNPMRVFFCQ